MKRTARKRAAADWLDRKIAEVEATGGKVWITVERDGEAWAATGRAL